MGLLSVMPPGVTPDRITGSVVVVSSTPEPYGTPPTTLCWNVFTYSGGQAHGL
ncbi:hypothetical protein D3C72_2549560 [compost metagenome]